MRARLLRQLRESGAALRAAAGNPDLRRLELALAALVMGQWSYTVVVAVYAYHQGGAAAVGLVGLIRMLPAAFAAPLTALLADRYRRQRVLLVAAAFEGLGVGITAAAVLSDVPSLLVYVITAGVQLATTAAVPARAALIPSVARSPEELTAANVAATTIDSVGAFAGPAVAGVLVAFADAGIVLAVITAVFGCAVALLARISPDERPRVEQRADLTAELLAGARALASESKLAVLTGLYASQTLVAGALNVLIVVMSLELLDLGDAGVGYLNAAIGIGGLAGAAVMFALVGGSRRLAPHFALGMGLWGIPMVLIGTWPEPVLSFVLLGLLGVGNTLVDVAGVTLLQRAVPDVVLARVFGVLESLTWGTIALGSIAASGLVAALGGRGALVVVGGMLPLLTALAWRQLRALDARPPDAAALALLRGVSIFAPLPPAVIEALTAASHRLSLAEGDVVFRRGETGDRFYVIARGEVEVDVDRRAPVVLGPGEFFGEIALLADVPRTATVRARTPLEAYALPGDAFVAAVTGHADSADAADLVIASRLGSATSRGASV
ncbi:MAG TPA: MFS transporter [Gaiellaceae bacterium]|nr:MFS transporter [Gaiellaceae bacterium]